MTSPLPPKRRDTRNLADLLRQDRQNLRQLGTGFAGGRNPLARPLRPAQADDFEDDSADSELLFENTDTGTVPSDGAATTISLSHVPIDGSEHAYYRGIALQRSDWSRTDTVLTIPGEPWFKAGDPCWVDYAYDSADEVEMVTPTLVNYTTVNGDSSSIAVPTGTQSGDLLVLVLSARINAQCTDGRFDTGYHHTSGTAWSGGIWVGTADGSGTPVSITLTSVPADGGWDCVGALASFHGSPMNVTANANTSGVSAPVNPAMPSAGTFGIAAISMGAGLVAGAVTDEATAAWSTVVRAQGSAGGKSSLYIGYCASGTPAGTWNSTGGAEHWDARIVGVQ